MNRKFSERLRDYLKDIKILKRDIQLLEKIEEGIRNGEFKMHLQFIVENKSNKIALAEALSRWETTEGEIIMPGKYIGIMERSGLITNFDYHMFGLVCEKLAAWVGTEFANVAISVNITRITISEKDFVSKIKDIAQKYSFDRSKLLIEITEDSIEKNLDVAKSNILKVKELGFRIALDDIGSGYTSLVSLCEYPIDIVKLDREILLLSDRERGRKLFLGIIALAHNLNLEVVCEGVETEEQNSFVSSSDCDYIQGWYYTKALPEIKAEEFARKYMNKN